ncbi:cytochrome c oxidase subunit II [Micromonospora sp. WMMD1082]|uniref:cytochrome c oxidase subunit II n=1 Tax=Micromonospora sp. WMMD1082 TaxID=3016104 RepID=UPI002417C66B|nr:cytochrome c oxidase subunit II [Micromonospora sp. WMMD1082]MDG4798228.1 cytochrome c oxidase subunit II [Micromonospora sp. WMMD1082]
MTERLPPGARGPTGAGGTTRSGRAFGLGALLVVAAPALTGCGPERTMLSPVSTDAGRAADLWWLMFWIGAVIWTLVTAATLYALYRRGRGQQDPLARRRWENTPLIWGGIVLPSIVLVLVTGVTVDAMRRTDHRAGPGTMVVQVIGHQWWWEVRYPERDVVTANEVRVPAGRPVRIELTTADVIHSFWVPALAGKVDLIPGRTNTLWINTDRPGVYEGQCAEFCGLQHARMRFRVVVAPEPTFRQWLAGQEQPATEPADELAVRGREVFLSASCVHCHSIRGTAEVGASGPDLTHLASRDTLAAGIMPNTKGHLGGWIVDPQQVKPGARMPGSDLSPDDLQALLAYLGSLE